MAQVFTAVAPMCCCLGFVILITFSIIFASRTGSEVKLWYNVPLCESAPSKWVSQGGSGLTCSNSTPAVLSYEIPQTFFLPAAEYTTFLYATDGVAVAPSDPSATTSTSVKINMVGKFSYDTATAAATPSSSRRMSNGRKLLKGSSSFGSSYSGPSYRSRNGGFSYYGSTFSYRRYGRYGRSVVTDQVIYVYTPTSIYSTRGTAGGSSFVAGATTSSCKDSKEGCEFVVSNSLSKYELEKAKFTSPQVPSETGSFKFSVQADVGYVLGSTSAFPNLFVAFATDASSPQAVLGWIFIPLGCIIMVFGTGCVCAMGINNVWICGNEIGGRKSYRSMNTSTANHGNPVFGGAGAGAGAGNASFGHGSKANPPMPVVAGSHLRHVDEDYTSLSDIGPRYASVDVTSNDIRSCHSSYPKMTRTLVVVNNDLSSFSGLQQAMPQLQAIDASKNNLRNFGGLSHPTLAWIKVVDNDITNITPSDVMPSTTHLNLANNDLKSLSGIEYFPALTDLDAGNNDIADLGALAKVCTNIKNVNLRSNNLTSSAQLLELVRLPSLRYLNIKSNDLRAIDVQAVRDACEGTQIELES